MVSICRRKYEVITVVVRVLRDRRKEKLNDNRFRGGDEKIFLFDVVYSEFEALQNDVRKLKIQCSMAEKSAAYSSWVVLVTTNALQFSPVPIHYILNYLIPF